MFIYRSRYSYYIEITITDIFYISRTFKTIFYSRL